MNAPEPADSNGVDGESNVESPEESHAAAPQIPQSLPQGGMPNNNVPQPYMTDQQALQYQRYLQTTQQGAYPMPPQQGLHQHQQR